ncbi:MAG: ABC transporter substrate-binding protein [Candidatus Eremiobacterota bacterium]
MKRAFLLALLLLLAGPAFAQTEVRFWHAMSGSRGDALQSLVDEFNRQHSDIRVLAVFKGVEAGGNDYADLHRALLESLALGTPPEVVQVYENWTPQLIEVGALTPMEAFFDGPEGLSRDQQQDFVQVFREANRFGQPARTWTLPFNKSLFVLHYNKEVLGSLGLPPPRTYEELRQTAREVHRRKGIPGLVAEPTVDLFGHYLLAYGGSFVVADKAVFGGPLGERNLAYWVDLTREGAAVLSPDAGDRFAAGQAAMYIETTSKIARLERQVILGVAPLPRGNVRAVQAAGTNLAILSAAPVDTQKAAWRFVRYLTSPEVSERWARETGYLPVRMSALRSDSYRAFVRANPNYAVGVEELSYAVVQPRTPAWEAIRGIVDDALVLALSGRLSPEVALDRAVALSNEMLVRLQGR